MKFDAKKKGGIEAISDKGRPKKHGNVSIKENKVQISGKGITSLESIVEAYKMCKKIVVASGFREEIAWQQSVKLEDLSESHFLREHAWVTLGSGMKERVVRSVFPRISSSFFNWESAKKIVENESQCRRLALISFKNTNKINAIISTSHIVHDKGFELIKSSIADNTLETIKMFPYMGPTTIYHLAKNIGLQVAKPDRHLVRLAEKAGYDGVQSFCSDISLNTGDSIAVVDIVLWRFATIEKDYLNQFLSFGRHKDPVKVHF